MSYSCALNSGTKMKSNRSSRRWGANRTNAVISGASPSAPVTRPTRYAPFGAAFQSVVSDSRVKLSRVDWPCEAIVEVESELARCRSKGAFQMMDTIRRHEEHTPVPWAMVHMCSGLRLYGRLTENEVQRTKAQRSSQQPRDRA